MTPPTTEALGSLLRSLRASDRFPIGRRILSLVALGVLAVELEPGARRALRDAAANQELSVIRALLIGLAESVEARFTALSGVFTEVLVNDAIHSRNLAETLSGASRVITELGQGIDRQSFGAWFNAQLEEVVSVGPAVGEIATSRATAYLLTSLADIKPGQTVYDPCCGVGGLLAHAWSTEPTIRVIGYEIHPISWALASLRLHLLGANAEIRLVDSLARRPPIADRVLCDPPYGPLPAAMANAPRFIGLDMSFAKRSFEAAFLTHCLLALPNHGRAAVLVSESFLVRRGAEEELRHFLVRDGLLEGIISLPAKVMPWVNHELAAIVLHGWPDPEAAIRLMDAGRVVAADRTRSRSDWSPMRSVVDAYFDPKNNEVALAAPGGLLGPGRFRPSLHFVTQVDRPTSGELFLAAARADAEAGKLKVEMLRLIERLDILPSGHISRRPKAILEGQGVSGGNSDQQDLL